MTTEFRFSQGLIRSIRNDLVRPHPFAIERVGFVFCTFGNSNRLILAENYEPVLDQNYVPDDEVGARINSTAIRQAMQTAMDNHMGAFQIHMHDHKGLPHFSWVDTKSLREVMPPFHVVCPGVLHGGVVISRNSATAMAWHSRDEQPIKIARVISVGFPLKFWKGN